MNLSKNLTLDEVTQSPTQKRLGINNIPSPKEIANLKLLAEKIFQPIREHFGCPILISSGYRSKELNKVIGGSETSQHCKGEALDLDIDGFKLNITNKDIFNFIKSNLSFDQLIWEYGTDLNPEWIHVSYSSTGKQRGEVLRCNKINGKPNYTKFV